MEDAEWRLIASYLTDLSLREKGLLSDGYSNKLENDLLNNCSSSDVVLRLKKIAADNTFEHQKHSIIYMMLHFIKTIINTNNK